MDNVSPGKLAIIIGGAVTFLFSFLSWWSYSFGIGSSHVSAWSDGLFGVATWAPLFGLVGALLVALPAFVPTVKLPDDILGFTINQLVLVCGFICLLITFGYLIGTPDHADIGFGLIIALLGSAAMVAGWFMDRQGVGVKPAGAGGVAPPAPGSAPPPQAAAPAAPPQPTAPQAPPADFAAPISDPPPEQTYIPGVTDAPQAAPPAYEPPAYDPNMQQPDPPPETGSF